MYWSTTSPRVIRVERESGKQQLFLSGIQVRYPATVLSLGQKAIVA